MKTLYLTLFLLTINKSLFACDCIGQTTEQAFKLSDLVVQGLVLTKNLITRNVSNTYVDSFQTQYDELYFKNREILEYVILVAKTYKGSLVNDTLRLRTNLQSNCHLDINVGQTYIIYAFKISYLQTLYDRDINKNSFQSSMCSKTKEFTKNGDIELDAIKKNER